LFQARASGADVRIAYSPLDALKIARWNPERKSSSSASGLKPRRRPMRWRSGRPKREGLLNFSMIVSHVLVLPAMRLILSSPSNRVQGFIGPGHVCTVMGIRPI